MNSIDDEKIGPNNDNGKTVALFLLYSKKHIF